MSSVIDKLFAAYAEKEFVTATTKPEVFAMLDEVRRTVEAMEDFTQFPDGPSGVVLYALLENASRTCPDIGDFNYVHQGYEAVLNTAFKVLSEEIDWFPVSNPRRE